MRFAWSHAAGAALMLVVVGACSSRSAPDPERTGAAREAIQGGTTDTTDTYAVGICIGGGCSGLCSGALILPNLVVTARHCVDDVQDPVDCATNPTFGARHGPFSITTATNMFGGATFHQVKQVITPTDNHVCGNDIALLVLNTLVPSSEATPIIPGVQYALDDDQYVNTFEAIGYGATSPNDQGTGTRRIRKQITIHCAANTSVYNCTDTLGNPIDVNPNEFIAGDGTCRGDSGSSAYDHASYLKGAPLSHGVLSRGGVSADGTTCEGSLYTRLDTWRDLIVNAANTASSNWTLYPKPNPDWTVYVPPKPKADAGAGDAAPSKPTTKPSGKGIGETCANDAECASKTCRDQGDGTMVCTTACTDGDNSTCPDGYECRQSMCFVSNTSANGDNATTTTSSTGGCAVGVGPTPTPWKSLALVGLGLCALARRRRNRS